MKNMLNFDISQKADFIIRFFYKFRYLRNLEKFKKIQKKNYLIFCDTASQFRCKETCYFYLVEQAEAGVRVSFNFLLDIMEK